MKFLWCMPEDADWESHAWISQDDGQTWQRTGDFDAEPGRPQEIDIKAGCPLCGSPLHS
jgi:hypothetical protein